MSAQSRGIEMVGRSEPLSSLRWEDAPGVLETEEAAYLLRMACCELKDLAGCQRRLFEMGRKPENPLPVMQFSRGGKMRFDRDLLRDWWRREIELSRDRLVMGEAKPPVKRIVPPSQRVSVKGGK
jgi:hypothetical protein